MLGSAAGVGFRNSGNRIPILIGLPRNSKTDAMKLSVDFIQNRWMVEFETCPDCSTNFTDTVHMIPLFLVLLIALVVFATIVLQPCPPVFGAGKVVVNDSDLHRTKFEHGLSAQVDFWSQAQLSLGAIRIAVGIMLGLQSRTSRNCTNAGYLAAIWFYCV